MNNAGIANHGNVLDQSMDEINRMVQINTLSLLTLTHLIGQDMKRQRRYVVDQRHHGDLGENLTIPLIIEVVY